MRNKSPLIVIQMELGIMANFTYIIADPISRKAMLIDPADDKKSILAKIQDDSLLLSGILLTHGHFDHTGGAKTLASEYNIPVYLSTHEAKYYTPDCPHLTFVNDSQKIPLGELFIECLHTPGHTPGCQCFLIDQNLFTGDTLFVDAIGRTDFPGGDPKALFESLQKIKQLPDNTMTWPGHNYGATTCGQLGDLKKSNPFLASTRMDDFLHINE